MTNRQKLDPRNVMTEHELATLGGGVVAYIKTLTADEVTLCFRLEGLPKVSTCSR